jgi:PAS domain S-box-containing protein
MPFRDEAGNIIGTFGISRDITARKQMEEELLAIRNELEQRVRQRTEDLQATNISLMLRITEREQINQKLETSLKQVQAFRVALDEHAIVALTDRRGVITNVNDKFCAISKYSREELIGKDHRIINSGYHTREYFTGMWRTIRQGKIWKGEIKNRAKDGTFYWVDMSIIPTLNEAGKPYQYIAVCTDITELKIAEAVLAHSLNAHELERDKIPHSIRRSTI